MASLETKAAASTHKKVYVVMGATGNIGGEMARSLLAHGRASGSDDTQVVAVVRNEAKAAPLVAAGATLAIVDSCSSDAKHQVALSKAVSGCEALFLFVTTGSDIEQAMLLASLRAASPLPKRVVMLSTVGAHDTNDAHPFALLKRYGPLEKQVIAIVAGAGGDVAVVRPCSFMSNHQFGIAAAAAGTVNVFDDKLDSKRPMVAPKDVVRVLLHQLLLPMPAPAPAGVAATVSVVSATLATEAKAGVVRVLELEGPERYSAEDVRAAWSRAVGRAVMNRMVPESTWQSIFESSGAPPMVASLRCQLFHAQNQGWVDFEYDESTRVRGSTPLQEELDLYVSRLPKSASVSMATTTTAAAAAAAV